MLQKFVLSAALLGVFLVAGSTGQGICRGSSLRTNEIACNATGCHFDGTQCREPLACTATAGDVLTYTDGSDVIETGVTVLRHPLPPAVARLCDVDTECSAKYSLSLTGKFVSGEMCNDFGALPPHGVDQTPCTEVDPDKYKDTEMKDYTGYPFKDDGVKQSLAREQRSVTALTESGDDCTSKHGSGTNSQCAFPLGFKSDIILKDLGVCIDIQGVHDKWIEIMAQSKEGSNGGSFCALHRDSQIASETGCTVNGDLIVRMESGVSDTDTDLRLMFAAQDNKDDSEIGILWRIVSSHIKSANEDEPDEDKDAEDWTLYRSGGDYPAALVDVTPENYKPDPVYTEASTSGASYGAAPCVSLVMGVVAIMSLFFA